MEFAIILKKEKERRTQYYRNKKKLTISRQETPSGRHRKHTCISLIYQNFQTIFTHEVSSSQSENCTEDDGRENKHRYKQSLMWESSHYSSRVSLFNSETFTPGQETSFRIFVGSFLKCNCRHASRIFHWEC
jgi:hypothetical protein